MWTLLPIIALLAALLWVAMREFYLLAAHRLPYTFYGKVLIARYPRFALLLAAIVAIGLGFLIAHFFGG
jgi:hypothetical protein